MNASPLPPKVEQVLQVLKMLQSTPGGVDFLMSVFNIIDDYKKQANSLGDMIAIAQYLKIEYPEDFQKLFDESVIETARALVIENEKAQSLVREVKKYMEIKKRDAAQNER
jgi:hypothetical protein